MLANRILNKLCKLLEVLAIKSSMEHENLFGQQFSLFGWNVFVWVDWFFASILISMPFSPLCFWIWFVLWICSFVRVNLCFFSNSKCKCNLFHLPPWRCIWDMREAFCSIELFWMVFVSVMVVICCWLLLFVICTDFNYR